MGGQQII